MVNINSESNEFIIGMFSNHPDAGSLPITLLITTTGNESVNFTIEIIDGIFYEGIVNPMEGLRVSISDSFVVLDTYSASFSTWNPSITRTNH